MIDDNEIVYESVERRIYRPRDLTDRQWLEVTDECSACCEQAMPYEIKNRGRAVAVIAAHLFELLENPDTWSHVAASPALKPFRSDWLDARCRHLIYSHVLNQHGAPTCYRALVGEDGKPITMKEAATTAVRVVLDTLRLEYEAPAAVTLLGRSVFFYKPPQEEMRSLIPLTVRFSFRAPSGTLLEKRLSANNAYAASIGLERVPQAGAWFERPVLEFFTSMEPVTRLLSLQEALLISGLTAGQFEEMIELSYNVALALNALLAEKEIEMWAGRLSYARGSEGLRLADAIGPDSMCMSYKGLPVGRDLLETVYKSSYSTLAGAKWANAPGQGEMQADGKAVLQRALCRSDLGEAPALAPGLAEFLSRLYGTLANHIVGRQLFEGPRQLDDILPELRRIAG